MDVSDSPLSVPKHKTNRIPTNQHISLFCKLTMAQGLSRIHLLDGRMALTAGSAFDSRSKHDRSYAFG